MMICIICGANRDSNDICEQRKARNVSIFRDTPPHFARSAADRGKPKHFPRVIADARASIAVEGFQFDVP